VGSYSVGKTEVLRVKGFHMPQWKAQSSHRLRWKITWAYVTTGREIYA